MHPHHTSPQKRFRNILGLSYYSSNDFESSLALTPSFQQITAGTVYPLRLVKIDSTRKQL